MRWYLYLQENYGLHIVGLTKFIRINLVSFIGSVIHEIVRVSPVPAAAVKRTIGFLLPNEGIQAKCNLSPARIPLFPLKYISSFLQNERNTKILIFQCLVIYPVSLNNLFMRSHLFNWRQPIENPNNPLSLLLKCGHFSEKVPIWYRTWSCSEPPILIRRGLKADSPGIANRISVT